MKSNVDLVVNDPETGKRLIRNQGRPTWATCAPMPTTLSWAQLSPL